MNHWIFRCNPKLYDIDKRLTDPNNKITWRVTRHANEIKSGDIAFIWKGGKNAGICAIIEIEESPKEIDEFAHEKKYCIELSTNRMMRIIGTVQKTKKFLPSSLMKNDKHLKKLSIFGFNQATNYFITIDEYRRIMELMDQ